LEFSFAKAIAVVAFRPECLDQRLSGLGEGHALAKDSDKSEKVIRSSDSKSDAQNS